MSLQNRIAGLKHRNRPPASLLDSCTKTVHMECAVSLALRLPVFRSSFFVPRSKPGTQCHTSATSLRKQKSKLPCKRPQIRGSAQGPFSPSRRLAILGGATNLERPVRVLATGTLGHPWPADVRCRHSAKVPSRHPGALPSLAAL